MIFTSDVSEAAKVAELAAKMLLATLSTQEGRAGSDLRRACEDLKSFAELYIVRNVIGEKLSECFDLARVTGTTLDEFDRVRETIIAEAVTSLVAVLVKQSCISFSLQQMSLCVIAIKFKSRADVDNVRQMMNDAFNPAEEVAADEMALDVYKSTVALHAAVTFHLYETAKPLPQMLQYRFGAPRPTLWQSYRLYSTAARADEIREENKVIHPAFAPREGRALAY